ncbi:MAG: EMC3/TMCO1 family protein [Methanomicrobiales archaeon]|nr:EMC3/TMCO1 family protein [Methanomicrobiales archaeon]
MDLKKHGGTIALILAMMLMMSYVIEPVRVGIGMTMDVLFRPLLNVFPFFIVIAILSTLTGLYSSIIQKYTIDYERAQEVQARAKEFQKEFREAQLSEDEKKIKKMEARRDKMMQEQLEVSREQFKPMSYILLVSIPIFLWLLYVMPGIQTTIVFPYLGEKTLTESALSFIPAWILWYMLCSLAISQIIRKSMNIGGL